MIPSIKQIIAFIIVYVLTFAFASGQIVTIDNLAVTATSGLTMTISGDFKNQNNGTIDNAGIITVSGNWTNNASNNVFSTNSGTVRMIGTSVQTIGGTNSTFFYNLDLNNTNETTTRYTLSRDQTIKNTLTLTVGLVDLSNNTMTIGTSASSVGTFSYTAGWLYGGTLKRWIGASTIADGSVAGMFPMGSSTGYRPFYVSAPSVRPSSGGSISVVHNNIAGNTPVSFTDIDITIDRVCNPYWAISIGNGLTGGTYNLRGEATDFTGITVYTFLRLTLAGSSVGVNASNAGSNTNPQVNRTGLTLAELTNNFHFSYPAAAALPIELLSFNAEPTSKEVKLIWITASEINTDYFTIERSEDGQLYQAVAIAKGAGNSSMKKYYSTTDFNPLDGLSFYRLCEYDFDGSVTCFPPVSVHFNKINSTLELVSSHYSNDHLVVTILSPVSENYKLDFYDALGKLIANQSGNLILGVQDITIPLTNKANGICLISLRTPNNFITKKIF